MAHTISTVRYSFKIQLVIITRYPHTVCVVITECVLICWDHRTGYMEVMCAIMLFYTHDVPLSYFNQHKQSVICKCYSLYIDQPAATNSCFKTVFQNVCTLGSAVLGFKADLPSFMPRLTEVAWQLLHMLFTHISLPFCIY